MNHPVNKWRGELPRPRRPGLESLANPCTAAVLSFPDRTSTCENDVRRDRTMFERAFAIDDPVFWTVLSFVLITGCGGESKVEGEVFIVTEDRQNVELGLVTVRGIQRGEMEDHLRKRRRSSRDSAKKKIDICAALLDSLTLLGRRGTELRTKIETQQEELAQIRRSRRTQARNSPSLEEYLDERRANVTELSANDRVVVASDGIDFSKEFSSDRPVYRNLSVGETGTVLDKKGGRVKIKVNGQKGWVYHRNLSRAQNYREYNSEYRADKQALVQKENSIRNRIDKLEEGNRDLQREMDSVERSLTQVVQDLASFRTQRFFLSELPRGTDSDKTGSDGGFELSLSTATPHFLVAQTSPSREHVEAHRWAVMVTPGEDEEVILSNDNADQLAERDYILNDSELHELTSTMNLALERAKEGESLPWEEIFASAVFKNGGPESALEKLEARR